jgi:hypothetical protein
MAINGTPEQIPVGFPGMDCFLLVERKKEEPTLKKEEPAKSRRLGAQKRT